MNQQAPARVQEIAHIPNPVSAPKSSVRGPQLALLSNGVSPHNDNHARIVSALEEDGWQVEVFAHDSLTLRRGEVYAAATPLLRFDLVWMLGLGEQEDFLDRCQILNALPPRKLVNSPMAMLTLHSKHAPLPYLPPTFSGNTTAGLLACAASFPKDQKWVIKPSAGSYGRGITRANSAAELTRALDRATNGRRYCVLQAYVDNISAGETRSLVLNGQIIGSYLRVPDRDFLANLSQGGRAKSTELNRAQTAQVLAIASELTRQGARFAAIDMAFPWLIEVNIANPGGLATLASLDDTKATSADRRLASALRSLLTAEGGVTGSVNP